MRTLSLLVAFSALVAGCAAPSTTTGEVAASTPAPPAMKKNLVHSVQEAEANYFDPMTIHVQRGETVTWDIVGEGHHTVDLLDPIDAAGRMPVSGDLGPGDTFEVAFPEAGTFNYYCKYHSNKKTGMLGTVVVA